MEAKIQTNENQQKTFKKTIKQRNKPRKPQNHIKVAYNAKDYEKQRTKKNKNKKIKKQMTKSIKSIKKQ